MTQLQFRRRLLVPGAKLAGMNVDVDHPDLIDLDTGDIYEWEPEPAGGGEPGYAHSADHDFAWPRKALEETRRLAEISTVNPAELRRLRDLYVNPPEDA